MVRLTKYSKDLTDFEKDLTNFEKELLKLKKYHFPCGNKYGIAIDYRGRSKCRQRVREKS